MKKKCAQNVKLSERGYTLGTGVTYIISQNEYECSEAGDVILKILFIFLFNYIEQIAFICIKTNVYLIKNRPGR